MKKILVAALLAAVSSFAAWDYFPVQEWGKGQGRITSGGDIAVRYTAMQNLELFSSNGSDVIRNGYVIGARYQIMPVFSAFLDFGLPIGNEEIGLAPGVQVSMNITETVAFGADAEFGIYLSDPNTFTTLKIGAEFDIGVGAQSQVQLGCDFIMANVTGDGDATTNIVPTLGFAVFKGDIMLGTRIAFGTEKSESTFAWGGIDITVGF